MRLPAKRPSVSTFKLVVLSAIVTALIGVGFLVLRQRVPSPDISQKIPARPVATVTNPLPQTVTTYAIQRPAATTPEVVNNRGSFQERPFPAAYESPNFQWTLADGKDTNVIRQLAHNPLEYARMVEENPRIFRRELVYLKETAAAAFEEARLTGKPVQQLTLPGADGQELQFEIVKSSSDGSSRQGMFSGHLVGNVDSLVTLAFQDGREAFTVLSPKENIFVVGEPREPGQVIVKAIDPNTYGAGPEEADDSAKK